MSERFQGAFQNAGRHTRQPVADRPRFYSVAKVAGMFGVSTQTLYREIDAGHFPAIRIRSRWLVPAKAIDDMVTAAVESQSAVHAADFVPEAAV